MKRNYWSLLLLFSGLFFASCGESGQKQATEAQPAEETPAGGGQEAVKDDLSQKDIVKVAAGSKDHTTLVAALKQAEYVNDLSNAGPFTVFAPTNTAFDKLPAGTVENLMKDENKAQLQNILEYHVSIGGYRMENFRDGQTIGQANGDNITLQVKDGKVTVNGTANIVATVPASNGIVYVIDAVLLPPEKKK